MLGPCSRQTINALKGEGQQSATNMSEVGERGPSLKGLPRVNMRIVTDDTGTLGNSHCSHLNSTRSLLRINN